MSAQQPSALKPRLASLRDKLLENLIERDVPVRLAILAALTGEHLLLLGPPGTAKSEIARRLRHAFRDAAFFERLLTRFSVPEELFGPLSIKALEEDRYLRQTAGYLPEATVAFIDEIFKANSAILNALLTLLNEREFDNGSERRKTPLVCAIGASNELPEGEELDALYDRFLLRFHVEPVSESGFEALLNLRGEDMPRPALELRLGARELEELRREVPLIKMPEQVQNLLKALRKHLNGQKRYVSDRRWRKVIRLLQTSAYTDGRNEVSIWDCWLLQHCLWNEPEQREDIYKWYCEQVGAVDAVQPQRLARLLKTMEDKLEEEQQAKGQATDEKGNLLYVGLEGKPVTRQGKRQRKNGEGLPLFLAPPGKGDRSNGNRGYTEEELKAASFQRYNNYQRSSPSFRWYDEKVGEYVDLTDYMKDSKNHLTEDFPIALSPLRYSKHHVEGRIKDVREIKVQVDEQLKALDSQKQSLAQVIFQHLWVTTEFSAVATGKLEVGIKATQLLQKRLGELEKGIRELPVEKGQS